MYQQIYENEATNKIRGSPIELSRCINPRAVGIEGMPLSYTSSSKNLLSRLRDSEIFASRRLAR